MDKPIITYTALPDATWESELDVLAGIYRFALASYERKKAADPTGDRNETKEVKDVGPTRSLSE